MGTSTGVTIPSMEIVEYLEETAIISFNETSVGSASCKYSLSAAAQETAQETVNAAPFEIDLTPNMEGQTILPGSVHFTWGGVRYVDRNGKIYKNPNHQTGLGVEVGSINYATGIATMEYYDTADNTITLHSLLIRSGKQFVTSCVFRTPGAPLRPGSFTFQATTSEGDLLSATSDFSGTIDEPGVQGNVDVENGIIILSFGDFVAPTGNESEPWYDEDTIRDGLVWKPKLVFADSFTYACVVYSYIPLDADLIGIDPVRLPTDGRVPVVKSGDVIVIHNTQTQQLPTGLTAGQEITLDRAADVVRLYDADGVYVPTTQYSHERGTNLLTMADPLDLTNPDTLQPFTEPLIANHRIEDMALVSDVQINGTLTLARGVSHDYPVADTYVSSALLFGDLQARLYNMFDQKTWTSTWSDDLIGDACTANFNDIDYPPVITNKGAVKERWAIVFDSPDHFNLIGEKYGVIADGYNTQDFQPINSSTGEPFFFIDSNGWGTGWATGNVVRFNTEPADHDFWVARTTLAGPVTEPSDQFTIQIRGDSE